MSRRGTNVQEARDSVPPELAFISTVPAEGVDYNWNLIPLHEKPPYLYDETAGDSGYIYIIAFGAFADKTVRVYIIRLQGSTNQS